MKCLQCKVAINLPTHLHSIRSIQLWLSPDTSVWWLLTKIMKLCCRPRLHGFQFLTLTDSALHCLLHTSASPPSTGAGWLGYHGYQDGYAAKTGGAVIPDVSQCKTVLTDQEEELHFQVQTVYWHTAGHKRKAILYFPFNFKRWMWHYCTFLIIEDCWVPITTTV